MDFYGAPNNKVIPKKYESWIGNNQYRQLMDATEGDSAKSYIRTAYRKTSVIGDGSTIAVRKFEISTGLNVDRNGNSHEKKIVDLTRQVEKLLKTEMSDRDRRFLEMEHKKLLEVQK